MKMFVRLCKLVGTGCPYKPVCLCSIACDTKAMKSASANKEKMCHENWLRDAFTS